MLVIFEEATFWAGISTGDFSEALAALLGKDAPGLSPTAIVRLKDGWLDEQNAWQKRDLSAKRYVYVLADGKPAPRAFTANDAICQHCKNADS
jgi:Transposase, Mutator family